MMTAEINEMALGEEGNDTPFDVEEQIHSDGLQGRGQSGAGGNYNVVSKLLRGMIDYDDDEIRGMTPDEVDSLLLELWEYQDGAASLDESLRLLALIERIESVADDTYDQRF